MSELATKQAGAKVSSRRLFLVFFIDNERYALAATDVVEVLPRLPLKPIAHAPAWVAGVFAHREHMVPVIDISAMTFGHEAVARTSTRLVLVNFRGKLLGLMLEQGKLTKEEIAQLGQLLYDKTTAKLSASAMDVLTAAQVDISALITGTAEHLIGQMK